MTNQRNCQLCSATLSPPRIIWVMGSAGSGKRTFSKQLIKGFPCLVRLDKDVVDKALCGDDRSSADYSKYYQRQAYDVLWDLAVDNVKDGKSVLIHSPNSGFYKHGYEELISKKLNGLIVLVKVIYCIAPESEIRRRLIQRNYQRDYPKIMSDNVWEYFVANEPQFKPPPIRHIEINTTLNEGENVRKAKEYIMSV
jgi:predicted kinase